MSSLSRTPMKELGTKVGEEVKLQGWVDTKRDHGKLTFIDLRDRTGKVQCVGFKMMGEISTESVIEIHGLVKQRPESMVNTELANGHLEIEVKEYSVLNKARELPLTIDDDGHNISEEVRLRYRYLDLRRERMRNIVKLRSDHFKAFREALYAREFTEVETPMLTKSTKEGSRDFIVPSRFQPGKFYALPQSPQQYKQLLMTAGVERYFQFARCIRDEDLRADRGFEFTQLDLEMSFVNREDVMSTIEAVTKEAVTAVGGQLKDQTFPVLDYKDAVAKYGSDKFDIRTEEEKKAGVLAFVWVINFPFFKKVDKTDAAEVIDGKSGWTFTHNPFSAPLPEHEEWLLKGENIDQILTTQYDLVCNGYEAGGGSIRAHRPEVLEATFKVMGYSDQEIQASVGHMLEAFAVGTPPHGGIALGMDRLVMLLANETSLKESIAFPMSSSGRTAVMDAPSPVSQEQLLELGIAVIGKKSDQTPHDFILDQLKQHHIEYTYHEHEPVFTSEDAARVRGTDISQGAKALVLQADKEFILLTLPADQRANLDALQTHLGVKKLAMASKDSVKAKTGLEVGCIPPFGSSVGLKTYVDQRLAANEDISFNAARHDRSITMKYQDFVKVEKPEVVQLA